MKDKKIKTNTIDYVVFILTHGRPDRVLTYTALRKRGYTGQIYLIVDNEDETIEQYRRMYGEQVIEFDKQQAAEITDSGDNFDNHRGVVYARNKVFDIAEEIGYEYFLVLDDDYPEFSYVFSPFQRHFKQRTIVSLDDVLQAHFKYFASIPATSIALVQRGDLIGGGGSELGAAIRTKRKAMNSFFCSTKRRFKFYGRINEDTTAYCVLGSRGDVFLTTNPVSLNQLETQTNSGGLTEIYQDTGTYVKSFYTVMYQPSSVKVHAMGAVHPRLHHRISWPNTVPKILREEHKKVAVI